MRIRWIGAAALAVAVGLTGCATPPQPPVSLNAAALQPAGARVGVAVGVVPKPDTYFPGAGCLLCIAVASGVHSKMTDQVRTWSTQELSGIGEELVKLLRARGLEPVLLPQPLEISKLPDNPSKEPNRARKDFSSLRGPHAIERLLVVNFGQLGATRSYSAYVPTGEPQATILGAAYLVNLGNQALEWYEPIDIAVPVTGPWDEPPGFPGLTNAYYQAVEKALDRVREPFAAK